MAADSTGVTADRLTKNNGSKRGTDVPSILADLPQVQPFDESSRALLETFIRRPG